MLRNLEKLYDTGETRPTSQGGRDVGEGHLEDERDDDLAGWQGVPATDSNVRALPEPHGAVDLTVLNTLPEFLDELHQPAIAPGTARRSASLTDALTYALMDANHL